MDSKTHSQPGLAAATIKNRGMVLLGTDDSPNTSVDALLDSSEPFGRNEMDDAAAQDREAKGRSSDNIELTNLDTHGSSSRGGNEVAAAGTAQYRVYKIRWFGLAQLVLMNIVVSWDWISFSPLSKSSADYFHVTESSVNWLSTSFLFAFCAISPAALWTLNRGGPKPAIITASVFILVGNWIRYGGARANNFGTVMFAQILIGLAQPFVLAAPTRYSDLWFTSRGRISATAVASLSNPFGGALGQLINPFLATKPSDIPNMVLYVAIISTVASIPSFFIPAKPRSPPCPSAEDDKLPLMQSGRQIYKSVEFWLVFIPFSVYVGFFNSFASLLNQILEPYHFSEAEAGICGAILIVVGLVTSAITSPIIDRYKKFLLAIKMQVPLLGIGYLAFTWAPQTGSVAAPYAISALLGAASFSLVPIALEWLIEQTHPVSPEVTSTICWTGGSLLGACFILISDALKAGKDAKPPQNLHR
ncbi:MAG: hypothetical protein M1813_007828 [Trichoglossum hirsutum]|nr:MAG: hypothetical protein M1813_007828 [Trichoglossum hirsutum]